MTLFVMALPRIADHDGILVSFNTKTTKQKQKTKIIYDYKNADIQGLMNYITDIDFNSLVFSKPTIDQSEIYSNILKQAFAQFVPSKTVVIRPTDQSWCNSFTRFLMRKKNRNYQFYKKCKLDYNKISKSNNPNQDIVTRLLIKTDNAHTKIKRSCK